MIKKAKDLKLGDKIKIGNEVGTVAIFDAVCCQEESQTWKVYLDDCSVGRYFMFAEQDIEVIDANNLK